MTYTDVFGGGVINPSDQAYAAYSISANLTLVWPLENASSSDIATQEIDINATVGGLSVTLPDATLVSVGSNIYLKNVGANAFNLLKSDSTLISSIATTTTYIVQLTDNTTPAGVWAVTAVGTSTPAVASALAGPGLTPYGVNQLATAHPVDDKSSTPYNVLTTDRASLLNWTGGAGTFVLPSAATAGDNFFIMVRNSGTGLLIVSAADDVDGSATKTFAIGESAFIVCDGISYFSVGYGQTDLNANSYLSIAIGGTGTYTLSAAEYAFSILNFTGALTGARTVEFPPISGAWYVSNSTSGSFDLSLKVAGGIVSIVLPQGYQYAIWSSGTEIANAVTAIPSPLVANPDTAESFAFPTTRGDPYQNLQTDGAGSTDWADESGLLGWFMRSSAPTGWVVAGGGTIGSATSGATTRANTDTINLYTQLWGCTSNTYYPIQDSAGSPTTRGANAAADFAADKRFPLPDMRGRSVAGLDNAGGTAGNVLQVSTTLTTSAGSPSASVASGTNISVGMVITSNDVPFGTVVNARTGTSITMSANAISGAVAAAARFSRVGDAQSPGSAGGEQNHTQALSELAQHDHTTGAAGFIFAPTATVQAGAGAFGNSGASSPNTALTGGSLPMNNVQPTVVMLPCLKL